MPLDITGTPRLSTPLRDSIRSVPNEESSPTIVSISDIHGYLEAARSALLTLADHPGFDPVVVADEDGTLHWANNNYVLVFNGDLIDRGPANEAVLKMVARLIKEAPPGRVRVTLGNHEAILLSTDHFGYSNWFAGQVNVDDRRLFLEPVLAGHVVAAYQGYNVTYAHAGSPDPYSVSEVNESLIKAAKKLADGLGTNDDVRVQQQVIDEHQRVLGVGDGHPKSPGAGLVWLDFAYLPKDAPPQVVGHTRHTTPQRKGQVHCQNVLRNNLDSEGGEAVFVEEPNFLYAVTRCPHSNVKTKILR
ncbi:metallophosphoesterase [Natronorubrum thiooxidans]|uniref:Calcineurin-like phosphoesterase n=1 Tax=Natronorubrum thiooxidans TaxID=308853 RepID=A0A1N7H302_9EURY|nr:metallophosphoesterase [Natronorubrum thiooxidans]SIS19214.1 Calcineurin-like phosphoesterase [Natronorubrum thiooxidans]